MLGSAPPGAQDDAEWESGRNGTPLDGVLFVLVSKKRRCLLYQTAPVEKQVKTRLTTSTSGP